MIRLNRKGLRNNELRAILKRRNIFHAGWHLSYALDEWPDGNQAGQRKQEAIAVLTRCEPDPFYLAAFERWKALGAREEFEQLELTLESRLYIGLTRDSALETGVTVNHTYGMPVIPGSAVKGVTKAWAEGLKGEDGVLDKATFNWLFGTGGDTGESGGLIFHDGWWVPAGKPFVAEIVTPHHQKYYVEEGKKPATDFDEPIPAPQIAVRGRFLFTVEGPQPWVAVGRQLMENALRYHGIGAKTTSGYGCFA